MRDYGYFSGILDGEGSISILGRNSFIKKEWKNRNSCYLRVTIYTNSRSLVKWLQKELPNGLHVTKRKARSKKHANSFVLYWSRKASYKILLRSVSFLLIKKKQALVGIAFQKFILEHCHPGRAGHSDKVLNKMFSLKEEINHLNRKGPTRND